MSKNVRYWLWFQKALGEGFDIKTILAEFGSVQTFFNATPFDWRMSTALTPRKIQKLEHTDISESDSIIDICSKNNWQIIDYDDISYPQRLKEIPDPPAVLFVDGVLPDIDNLVTIAMVGTRKASEYSIKVTNILSRGVTECGAVVVSGGALGVDSAAHKGALMAGGKTIAVLGCGFGTSYLAANKSLRDTIRCNGALVTEYPPFVPAGKRTFPMRNRIISGLSLATVVVEAGVRSGSLITARYAVEQGRDVFAIPASLLSTDFSGTNKLIEDGAMVATKPEQILSLYTERFDSINISKVRSVEELMYDTSDKSANISHQIDKFSFENLESGRIKRIKTENEVNNLIGDNRIIYECLEDNFVHIDVIIQKTGLTGAKVISGLTQLEILGLAQSASGKRYKLS